MTSILRSAVRRLKCGKRMFLRTAPGIGVFLLAAMSFAAVPERRVIEKYIDKDVLVFGNYAAVRLPIKNGVTLWNPVAMARDSRGLIYVANYTGEIYSLHDSDGDGLEDTARLFCDVKKDGLRYPTGLVFKGNDLYVGTTQEVRIYSDTDGNGVADRSHTFFNDFPWTLHPFDWTFALRFGPDEHLYLTLSNDRHNSTAAPDPLGLRGSMLKISPDGKKFERVATGLRFAFGSDFSPNGDLFFTDNKGDDNPNEELNLFRPGAFYGNQPAKFGTNPVTLPVTRITAGRGMGGMRFNSLSNDFGGTAGHVFIACWGPDGQFTKGSITRVELHRQPDGTYRSREHAFAEIAKVMDLEFGVAGDLYVAQFGHEAPKHSPFEKPDGAIYRFIHAEWVKPARHKTAARLVEGDIAHGKEVFASYGCAACHSVNGSGRMLGPDLHDVGEFLNRDQFMEAVLEPSRNIKSGHETERVVKTDGEVISGGLVASSQNEVVLMLAGNLEVKIPRSEIASQEMVLESLMPPNLLATAPEKDINDLLAYLKIVETRPTWLQAKVEQLRLASIRTVPGVRLRYKATVLIALVIAVVVVVLRKRIRKRRAKLNSAKLQSLPLETEPR